MIHYHGGPITPNEVAIKTWTRRHAMVSFANPQQIELAAEVAQSFALDNGAFTFWTSKKPVDWERYSEWVDRWRFHPGFDFCLLPDSIEGGEKENDKLIEDFLLDEFTSVPVWHLHESVDRLHRLARDFPRVALGSSGVFSVPGSEAWWGRMGEAMHTVCSDDGRPITKLHGLRMLNPTIFSQLPLASADSTNVARNIGLDERWSKGTYIPKSKEVRAAILLERIESHASAARWTGTRATELNFELIG